MNKAIILITRFAIACLIGTSTTARSQEIERKAGKPSDHPARIQEATKILTNLKTISSVDEKVDRLVDLIRSDDPARAQAAVTSIIILGNPTIPSLIRRIDDASETKIRIIYLRNNYPGAFEESRVYGVGQTTDCINFILNDLTGVSFGFVDLSFDVDQTDPSTAKKLNDKRSRIAHEWKNYYKSIKTLPPIPRKTTPAAGPRLNVDHKGRPMKLLPYTYDITMLYRRMSSNGPTASISARLIVNGR